MKKTVIFIISIFIVVLAVAGGVGIYFYQKEEQAAIAAEEKKEQEKQEAELKEYQTRYEVVKTQSENLILSEEEQAVITEEFQKMEKSLGKKDTVQSKKILKSLEQKITEIETANAAMLTEKTGQIVDYHTEYYSTENQSVLDAMLTQYNDFLTAKAYKNANTKLDELLGQIVALKEEPEQKQIAVAKTEKNTKKTSGNEKQQTATTGKTETVKEDYPEEGSDYLNSLVLGQSFTYVKTGDNYDNPNAGVYCESGYLTPNE